MTGLQKNMIRYKLIEKHIELTRGSAEDMRVAKRLLHFLNKGEIRLGLSDEDWRTEQILEEAGVHLHYSSRGYSACARIEWRA